MILEKSVSKQCCAAWYCSSSVVVGCLVVFAQTQAAHAQASATCTGRVDGDVVDARDHEPIAGATVTAGEQTTFTDVDGHFVLKGVCPGSVTVAAERADYVRGTRKVSVRRGRSVEISLKRRTVPNEVVTVIGQGPVAPHTQSSTTLTGRALERTRGQGFASALSQIAGVTELQSASGMAKPMIRGHSGRRLSIVMDSVRHRSQNWGLDHAPEIDPFSADKITVVRGAAGVRYGSDAIGGAIVIAPPKHLETRGVVGEVHSIGVSNGHGGALAGRIRGATSRGLAFRLEASGKRLAASRTPDYALDNTGVREWTAGGSVRYRRRKDTDFELTYRHYAAALGVCACLSIDTISTFFDQLERQEPLGVETYNADFEIERPYQAISHDVAQAQTEFRRSFGTLTLRYAFQHDRRREFDVVRGSVSGAQFNFRLFSHDLQATLAHRPLHLGDHWHLRGEAGVVGLAQINNYSGLQLIPDWESRGGGAFVTERLLGHDMELSAGVRYDFLSRMGSLLRRDFQRLVRSDQLAMDACDGGAMDPDRDEIDCHSNFHSVSATLGGLYQLSANWEAKVNLATAARAPTPDEQYLNGTSPTSPVLGLGKPDLGVERSYSASLTSSWRGHAVAAEASVYANYISDYIYFSPAINDDGEPILDILIRGAFPRFVTQPVDAVFYGADGGVTAKPFSWLQVGGQLSLVRANNRTANKPLMFVPPTRATGRVTATKAKAGRFKNLFASASGTYVARQNRFDINADLAPPPPAYFVLGAELGFETEMKDRHLLRVALSGSNLLNTRYREYTSLVRYFADRPGWQAMLRMSLHLNPRESL